MTPERSRTIRRLALSGVAVAVCAIAFIAWVVWLLVIEGQAVAQGGNSTISELFWSVWAAQPWVILLLNNIAWAIFATAACIVSYLGGHFTAQNKDTYEAVRKCDREHGAAYIACILGSGLLALLCLGAKAPEPTVKLIVSPRNGFALPTKPLRVHAIALTDGLECPMFEWDCGNDSDRGSHASDCNDPSDARDCKFAAPGDYTVAVRASDSSSARVATAIVLVR